MTNEEAFLAWAPPQVRWSDWAKPVCFAQAPQPAAPAVASGVVTSPASELSGWRSLPLDWLPSPGNSALIVDLPGPVSVAYGLAAAQRGYRPVPLYNACTGPSEIIDMQQVIRALFEGARALQEMEIPSLAPPAFLVDAERLQGGNHVQPGRFDNRWMVFPQDFPSANVLLSQHIRQVLVIRKGSIAIPEDLAHVLVRWKEAGLELLVQDALTVGPPQPLDVSAPKHFKSIWYRLLAMAGLRRNSAGGFGSVIPQPSSGG